MYDINYICNLKYKKMNLFIKWKQAHIENKPMITKAGRGWERDKLGAWDQYIQITICKIANQHCLLYSTENHIQYPVTNHNGREYEKEYIYLYN